MDPSHPQLTFKTFKGSQDLALLGQSTFTEERTLGIGLDLAITPVLKEFQVEPITQYTRSFFGGHIEFMPMTVGALTKEITSKPSIQYDDFQLLREWCSMRFNHLGTTLFDDAWRPLVMLIGLLIGTVLFYSSNSDRALGVLIFLSLYNLPLWIFRIWSFRLGWKYGRDIIPFIEKIPVERISWLLRWIGAGLAGMAFVITSKEWGGVVFNLGKHLAEELAWVSVAVGFLIGYLFLSKVSLYTLLVICVIVVFAVGLLL